MTSLIKQAPITHVIFDFDGVLVDSERQYSVANAKCLEPYGKTFTKEMKIAQMGRKKPDAVSILLELNDLKNVVDINEYIAQYDVYLKEFIPRAAELPGVSTLINHFYAEGIPLAICTGSDHDEFQLKTSRFSAGHWLEKIPLIVLSGSDPEIKNGKPHPEPYFVTLRRFKTQPASPKNVLVFEDSINGAKSAIAAGMTVVMIPQPEFLPVNWPEIRKELEPQLAEILLSLEDFEPTKYGLPALSVP